jgi:hypothetical protein
MSSMESASGVEWGSVGMGRCPATLGALSDARLVAPLRLTQYALAVTCCVNCGRNLYRGGDAQLRQNWSPAPLGWCVVMERGVGA